MDSIIRGFATKVGYYRELPRQLGMDKHWISNYKLGYLHNIPRPLGMRRVNIPITDNRFTPGEMDHSGEVNRTLTAHGTLDIGGPIRNSGNEDEQTSSNISNIIIQTGLLEGRTINNPNTRSIITNGFIMLI